MSLCLFPVEIMTSWITVARVKKICFQTLNLLLISLVTGHFYRVLVTLRFLSSGGVFFVISICIVKWYLIRGAKLLKIDSKVTVHVDASGVTQTLGLVPNQAIDTKKLKSIASAPHMAQRYISQYYPRDC